jgi:hypothetical protein
VRTKVTLVLVFLNVALFFFIFKFERAWRTDAALQETRRRVLGSETADIRSISVTNGNGGQGFQVVRIRDDWLLTQPIDWPANRDAVQRIISELQLLDDETNFKVADLPKNGMSLADYGLDKPKMTVAFTSGGASPTSTEPTAAPTTILRLGDTTPDRNRLYVLSPDGTRVHVVNRALIDALSVPVEQLRADTIFTIHVFEARALSVQSSGARARIRRDGSAWLFDTIINAHASKTAMDLAINALNKLHVKSFPPTPPATPPSDAPSLRVTIDGNGRSETLVLGNPVTPGTPANTAPGTPGSTTEGETEYFAQLAGPNSVRAPVFTVMVSNQLLENLRHAQEDLRERRILEFDPATVASVTLSAPNRPGVTLQRLDVSNAESPWQVVRRTDGAAGAQATPADTRATRQLLDKLSLLSATKFESDVPSSAQLEAWGFNRPEREITLGLTAAPGVTNRTLLLQLGVDGRGGIFARVGTSPSDVGASVYAVNVDLTEDFPVDLIAWRDRTLRELPPTARISALKLADLSTGKVIYETTLDAAGQPVTAPRDAAALRTVLAALRSLRAKGLVQEGFPEKVMVGGDERSWRYQLDATVVLPGGGGGEQTNTSTLFFTERTGGSHQLGGAKDLDLVFELEQPLVDALWSLTYGARDPGPQLETK